MTKSEKPKPDKPDEVKGDAPAAQPVKDRPVPVHHVLDAETGYFETK